MKEKYTSEREHEKMCEAPQENYISAKNESNPYAKTVWKNDSKSHAKKCSYPSDLVYAALGGCGGALGNVWRERYLKLQAQMLDDTRNWTNKFEHFIEAQMEQAQEHQDAPNVQMHAFEEAYKMLMDAHKENQQLRERIKELER